MAKTWFFKSCLGVFQGGGCRAAAFVGAYEEAVRSGVSFTEVAGTSAGSIVAALVGAGAGSIELRTIMSKLDFRSFVSPPNRTAPRGIVGRALTVGFPKYADLLFDQGFHSSIEVKRWVNNQLAALLPTEKQPLQFRSLRFPTYIVSTDLARSEVKVWSQESTPNELVADAVHASCAIPIFFQPIDRRHVDGGVLSNLPAFVFSKREHSHRPLASRVLAFTLVADEVSLDAWNTELFLQLLASAVVDGSQKLQLDLLSNIHVVSIPTGSIKATDFDKMNPEATNMLIQNGVAATRSFFEQELLNVRPAPSTEAVCYGIDEMYTRVTESLELVLDRIVVADINTDWVYSLFPSLLCWRAKGVRVDVLLPALGDKPDGVYRRQLLRAMGAHVTEIPNTTAVPFRAFLIITRDPSQSRAVVGVDKQSRTQSIEASYYQGFLDSAVIRAVLAQLDTTSQPYQAHLFRCHSFPWTVKTGSLLV
jgi:predicted acylesterase/phospholipase RssA